MSWARAEKPGTFSEGAIVATDVWGTSNECTVMQALMARETKVHSMCLDYPGNPPQYPVHPTINTNLCGSHTEAAMAAAGRAEG